METADTFAPAMPPTVYPPLEHSFERPLVSSQRVIVPEPGRRIRDRVRRAVVDHLTDGLDELGRDQLAPTLLFMLN